MEHKYLLSICIPTYNREAYLRRLLDSIVLQEWFTDEVSIVINDWPSTDNTEGMVLEYQKKYKNIYYSRNDVAVGMLPAILESIDMSNGLYTWLFGSDDFMYQDALKITLNVIRENTPEVILSNRFTIHDFEESKKYSEKQVRSLFFHGFSDFWVYLGIRDELTYRDKWNYLTFMSIFCFQTEHYRTMLQYVTNNIASIDELKRHYFNYIVIVFSQLFASKKLCLIEQPRLVFCQWGNTSWKPNRKINQDIKMLMQYLENTYNLPRECHRLFRRIYFESVIYGNFIYKIQSISFFKKLIEWLMKNEYIKWIYFRCIKMLSGSR